MQLYCCYGIPHSPSQSCEVTIYIYTVSTELHGINLLWAFTLVGTVQQSQALGQKAPGFGWATFR